MRGGVLLLLIVWVLSFAVIAAMPAAFPAMQSASFFSNALIEPRQPFSIADLYFTANPFHSLSNAVIPAVVLFSSMIGIGLIGLKDRERVLGTLRVLNASIIRITQFIISLTPIGVFAIGAVTAGTMTPETFARLEVYFITFGAASLLLAFLVLPLLVTALTPFRYREIIAVSREALLTAFVTNNAFIVLPILVDRTRVLLRRHRLLTAESESAAELLVPILFNFPNAGRLLTLLFIPFAAWLAGSTLSTSDYSSLFAVGVPSYFAKAQVALPFLMDFFGLPHDLFQLYIPTTIISGKFDSMVTAMNLLVFALLGAGAMGGFLVIQRRRLLVAGAMMTAGTVITVIAVRLLLDASIDTTYRKDEMLRQMHTPRDISSAIIHRDLASVTHRGYIQRSAGTRLASRNAAPCVWAMTRRTCPSASSTSTASSLASTSNWPRAWRNHSVSRPSSSPSNGRNCPRCSPDGCDRRDARHLVPAILVSFPAPVRTLHDRDHGLWRCATSAATNLPASRHCTAATA